MPDLPTSFAAGLALDLIGIWLIYFFRPSDDGEDEAMDRAHRIYRRVGNVLLVAGIAVPIAAAWLP